MRSDPDVWMNDVMNAVSARDSGAARLHGCDLVYNATSVCCLSTTLLPATFCVEEKSSFTLPPARSDYSEGMDIAPGRPPELFVPAPFTPLEDIVPFTPLGPPPRTPPEAFKWWYGGA